MADHTDGMTVHLAQRDVAFVAISHAPLAQIARFRQRMGWKFRWVSSHGSDFNHNFHVSFTPEEKARGEVYYNYRMQPFEIEELPGISVFVKNGAGEVFHTYSAYRRGDEDGLSYPMAWVRHHDRYDPAPVPAPASACCQAHA